MTRVLADLRTKIFADGADLSDIATLATDTRLRGFTTNPTLMRQAGVADYEAFCRRAVELVAGRPISFEVFADEPIEIRDQARHIAAFGDNVYVKVPVTTTRGAPLTAVVKDLGADGVRVNVTAVFTPAQVHDVVEALGEAPAYVSVFAGRIADAGIDPVPIVAEAATACAARGAECIWASPREVYNLVQADAVGCQVITMTRDLLAKLDLLGRDLGDYSLETVRMFHHDAAAAGYELRP